MAREIDATAGGVHLRLTPGSLYVGERRIRRDDVTGIEFDRRGTLLFTGAEGVLARVDFRPAERRPLAAIAKALAPRRKSLGLFLDREAYRPGDTVRGHLELHWPKAAPVRGVRVGLYGAERTRITVSSGSGKHRSSRTYREEHTLISSEFEVFGGPPVGWWRATGEALKRLMGATDHPILTAGRHRWDFEFELPGDALPSFDGGHADVGYELYAQVDIPLGFDLTTEGVVFVGLAEGAEIAALKGRVERSRGFLKADVDMKVVVEACRLEVGERLRGSIFVRNHSSKRIRGATIRLLALEEAQAEGRSRDVEHELNAGYLPAPDPASPEQDITFEIPVNGPFPYRGRHSRLDYALEASLDTALGFDTTLRIPLETE